MDQRRFGAILGIAAVTALVAPAAGTTWYVNGSCGNDAWSGIAPACAAPGGPKATIQAGINAASNGDQVLVAGGAYAERINLNGKSILLHGVDGPTLTAIDGEGQGSVVTCTGGEGPSTRLEGFTIRGGDAFRGGGLVCFSSSPTVANCVFTANHAIQGGAVGNDGLGGPRFEGCLFTSNEAVTSAGGIYSISGPIQVIDCAFVGNTAGSGAGIILSFESAGARIINCRFLENASAALGTAIDGSEGVWSNCVFWNNASSAPVAATFIAGEGTPTISNCTFTGDNGRAIDGNTDVPVLIGNCIIRGNALGSVHGSVNAGFSNIEGGWPGTGNIDADPLFVQPGTADLRLSYGSPCVDAGDNAALPPDEFDLDGDGNTAEPMPIDLAGGPRVVDSVVDMGAYEGQFAPGAPASSDNDVDQGEFAALVPEGGPFNPIESPAVLLTNVSGGDNATATATQIDGLIHPGAGGFSDLGSVVVLQTSLEDGEFKATVFLPFDSSALGGAAPQQVRATWYDGAAGNWAMAVWGNANASPGFMGPIGDRIYIEAPGPLGVTQDPGDHGVYWDAAQGQGFAWANVDHASDFGVGIAPCPADCVQTPDGQVNIVDMLILLNDWGLSAGISCDVDSDGSIGAADFAGLLKTWGPCTGPAQAPGAPAPSGALQLARAAPAGSADLDANGAVGVADLELLKSCWGAQEAGCPADLDGDGSVGVRDYLHLLAAWDQSASP